MELANAHLHLCLDPAMKHAFQRGQVDVGQETIHEQAAWYGENLPSELDTYFRPKTKQSAHLQPHRRFRQEGPGS